MIFFRVKVKTKILMSEQSPFVFSLQPTSGDSCRWNAWHGRYGGHGTNDGSDGELFKSYKMMALRANILLKILIVPSNVISTYNYNYL